MNPITKRFRKDYRKGRKSKEITCSFREWVRGTGPVSGVTIPPKIQRILSQTPGREA